MDRWVGKVAVVTGASAGIGAAICVALADNGMKVVGLARRTNLINELRASVSGAGSIASYECDVRDAGQISAAFRWLDATLGCVHVVVNNAGVLHKGNITDVGDAPVSEEALVSTIDVNLKGLVLCTRHAVASMKRHGFDGHVIMINSIAGHYVPAAPDYNVYSGTKHAVTAFTRSLAGELAHYNSNIKVTFPHLAAEAVADTVLYALSTPAHVNIEELTVTPVAGVRF